MCWFGRSNNILRNYIYTYTKNFIFPTFDCIRETARDMNRISTSPEYISKQPRQKKSPALSAPFHQINLASDVETTKTRSRLYTSIRTMEKKKRTIQRCFIRKDEFPPSKFQSQQVTRL